MYFRMFSAKQRKCNGRFIFKFKSEQQQKKIEAICRGSAEITVNPLKLSLSTFQKD